MTRSEAIAHIETCDGGCGLDVMPAFLQPECEFCGIVGENQCDCGVCEMCGENEATATVTTCDEFNREEAFEVCAACLDRRGQ